MLVRDPDFHSRTLCAVAQQSQFFRSEPRE